MKEKQYYLKIIHILAKNVAHLNHDDTVDLMEATLGDCDDFLLKEEIDKITSLVKQNRLPQDYLLHIVNRSRAYIESKEKSDGNLKYLRKEWEKIDRIFKEEKK